MSKIYTGGSGDGIDISNYEPCLRGADKKVCQCLKYLKTFGLNCIDCLGGHEKWGEYESKYL